MKSHYYLLLAGLLLLSHHGTTQSHFETAQQFFSRRAEGAEGLTAKRTFINQAIRHYKKAEESPEVVGSLLRAYEFKGAWTGLSDRKRKKTYQRSITLAERKLDQYPDNLHVKYWYLANLGRWGAEVGPLTAAKEGLAEKMKVMAQEIVDRDPEHANAIRILGIMHLKLPQIPFVLTWPDKGKALELLRRAHSLAPENPANGRFYAEALLENGEEQEARKILNHYRKSTPRADRKLEDKTNLVAIGKLYEETFD